MKRSLILVLAIALSASALTGCAAKNSTRITVISREEGSGTRGAFVELFGVMEKNPDGIMEDYTTAAAEISSSTAEILTSVAGNKNAVGYISIGALNSTVKAMKIDGVEATAENINNGTYSISRPFNIAAKGNLSEAAADFVRFILSAEGQQVVADKGYIAVADTGAFRGTNPSGKIVVAGSSSVSPVMEKLIEAYKIINPNVVIELQESDSSTGINSAREGSCDIGMASRELKSSEIEAGLISTVIALDGIAVIVNQENSIDSLSAAQVKSIYTGAVTDWAQLN